MTVNFNTLADTGVFGLGDEITIIGGVQYSWGYFNDIDNDGDLDIINSGYVHMNPMNLGEGNYVFSAISFTGDVYRPIAKISGKF